MLAFDWRSIAVGVVFLLDLVVFADLIRAEWRDFRAARARQTNFSRTSRELSQPMRSKVSPIQRSAVS